MPEPSPLEQALARAGDGVCVVGADGRIVRWNRAAEKILGYLARDAVGRPCCDIFAADDETGNRLCYAGCHILTLVRMNEPVQSFDMRTRTKSGHGVWLNVSILSIPPGNGTAPSTVHLFRDVTATKELLTLIHERLSAPAPGEEANPVLTRREQQVLRMMTSGSTTKATAATLHVSPATVRNHVQNILSKLGVHSRLEAVAYANKHRLL